jgi:hypothetical protein
MSHYDRHEEIRLPGNVGGAVRAGNTVRRSTGPWRASPTPGRGVTARSRNPR